MLELFEKIVKEYSGGARCELGTVLSEAEDSITDVTEVPTLISSFFTIVIVGDDRCC